MKFGNVNPIGTLEYECSACQSAREAQAVQHAKDVRIEEIKVRLVELDNLSIRALRGGSSEDYVYLEEYETEAVSLRAELATLQ